MITCEIFGGLGNQLFQIFAVLAYSFKYNIPFYFGNDSIIRIDWRRKVYWESNLLKNLLNINNTSSNNDFINYYNDPVFHYTEIPFSSTPIKLFGYFQSYKYFVEHKEQIYQLINIKETQNIINEKFSNILTNYKNITSLHFRMGDYIEKQNHHPIIPVKYYEKALYRLICDTNMKDDWTILYFCEESDIVHVNEQINYLKQNEKFINFTFINIPFCLNVNDWEQLIIMSLCQNNIIANSTFSWWGAYLNNKIENHNVYYPNIWFGPDSVGNNTKDLFPSEWTQINI